MRRDWLVVTRRRRAADPQHSAYRRRPRAPSSRASSPWLARKDADWYIDALYDFAAELGATIVRTTISRTIIDVNRDPTGASLYPGQATTELVPDDDLRRRAALSRRARRPTRPRSPSGGATYFDPYHAGAAREIARLRARHPRVVLYDAIRSARASRACSRASCRTSISEPIGGRAADPALRERRRADPRGERREPRRRRPLQGRLDHAQPSAIRRRASTPCRWSSPAAAICASREPIGPDNWPTPLDDAACADADARDARTTSLQACSPSPRLSERPPMNPPVSTICRVIRAPRGPETHAPRAG